jgi:cytochrome c-type biogenesis protein CcmI
VPFAQLLLTAIRSMSFAFFAAALIMTLAAVALVVSPLLRDRFKSERRLSEWRLELNSLNEANSAGTLDSARYAAQRAAIGEAVLDYIASDRKHAAPTMYAALAIAILVPLAAFGGYKWIDAAPEAQVHGGTAGETPPAAMPVDHGGDMQAAIARLAEKLRQSPDDAQGWALLARTYKATEHYPEARDAFKHAVDAAPGDAGLEREYAAAETPDDLQAQAQPQQCDVLEPGSASTLSACAEPPPNGSARITVKVYLAPKLKAKVLPTDTLYVFAKAAQGPAMPLAIARLTAAELPASVTLTDGMSMMPNMTLSKFPQVVLGARISKSGNATAQSGDLQVLSAAVANSPATPIQLTIDRAVQ